MPTGNTDWLKTLFGNSFTHEHSLSVNGGTDKIQYYLSANYLDQGGLLKFGDDNKQRYSLLQNQCGLNQMVENKL